MHIGFYSKLQRDFLNTNLMPDLTQFSKWIIVNFSHIQIPLNISSSRCSWTLNKIYSIKINILDLGRHHLFLAHIEFSQSFLRLFSLSAATFENTFRTTEKSLSNIEKESVNVVAIFRANWHGTVTFLRVHRRKHAKITYPVRKRTSLYRE